MKCPHEPPRIAVACLIGGSAHGERQIIPAELGEWKELAEARLRYCAMRLAQLDVALSDGHHESYGIIGTEQNGEVLAIAVGDPL